MQIPEDALLRIFIGESDKYDHHPLYEVIVKQARELHLAGATMLRGLMGFGKSARIHTEKILQLSLDDPVIIEIIDTQDEGGHRRHPGAPSGFKPRGLPVGRRVQTALAARAKVCYC